MIIRPAGYFDSMPLYTAFCTRKQSMRARSGALADSNWMQMCSLEGWLEIHLTMA